MLFAAPQLANGRYRVTLTAPTNLTYVVETSVDLGSWSGIVTNTGPSQLDEAVTPFTRYFRAVSR